MGLFYTKICTLDSNACPYIGDNRECNCGSCVYSVRVHKSDLKFCADLLNKQMLISEQLEQKSR